MAISVPNTIQELQLMSKRLGIFNQIKGTKKDGTASKEDYIIPIRSRILKDMYGDNIPLYISLLLDNIKSPMLAKRIDELKESDQEEIWNSDEWYFEEKIDGIRCFMIKTGNTIKVLSREIQKSTLLPIEIPLLTDVERASEIDYDFILDCELVSDNPNTINILNGYGMYSSNVTQSLEELLLKLNPILSKRILRESDFRFNFNVIDCLYINGWMMSETLDMRKTEGHRVVSDLSHIGVRCREVKSTNTNKEWFYNTCLKTGLEGCICKRADGIYIPDTTRKKDGWIKIKECKEPDKADNNATVREGTKVYDTIDGFITGFHAGTDYVEAVEISAFVDGKQEVICWADEIDDFLKGHISSKVGTVVTLRPEMLGRVVELDGFLTGILRFRFDKTPQECRISKGLLDTIKMYKTSLF